MACDLNPSPARCARRQVSSQFQVNYICCITSSCGRVQHSGWRQLCLGSRSWLQITTARTLQVADATVVLSCRVTHRNTSYGNILTHCQRIIHIEFACGEDNLPFSFVFSWSPGPASLQLCSSCVSSALSVGPAVLIPFELFDVIWSVPRADTDVCLLLRGSLFTSVDSSLSCGV